MFIRGNTHVPMSDLSNGRIANHPSAFLRTKGLDWTRTPTLSPTPMKPIVITLAALSLACSTPARVQDGGSPSVARDTTAERELLGLSREKWRWMSERKVDTLAALFHEDAVFVHMGGSMSRKQELDVIRSGGIHYEHAEIQDASVRVIGTTAIVSNRIRLDAVVGGNEVTNPFVVTEVYVRQGGTWKLGALSFTRLLQ